MMVMLGIISVNAKRVDTIVDHIPASDSPLADAKWCKVTMKNGTFFCTSISAVEAHRLVNEALAKE